MRTSTQASTGLDRVQLAQEYNDFALAQITELMDGRLRRDFGIAG